MFRIKNFISMAVLLAGGTLPAAAQTTGRERVVIETPYGNMTVALYKETPLHSANFLKLVREGFYDSTLFHRVINQFMIQGGDPLSRHAAAGDSLGHGDLGYTVPAEINRQLIHKKGALCAARESDDINPGYASSASQFYIVMGKQRTMQDLAKYEDRINNAHRRKCEIEFVRSQEGIRMSGLQKRLAARGSRDSLAIVNRQMDSLVNIQHLKAPLYHFNETQVKTYTTVGGTPHLDNTYTVFGEVTDGIEVIDKIAAVKTDGRDRPITDVRIKMYLKETD
jgi:cyclophilin family peptidyl-prolyl cis-trans isomerase